MGSLILEAVRLFHEDPVLSRCPAEAVARSIPYLTERSVAPEEKLFAPGEQAERMFLIGEGSVRIRAGEHARVQTSGIVGEEAMVGVSTYLTEAVAETPVRVLEFSPGAISILVEAAPRVKPATARALTRRFQGAKASPRPETTAVPRSEDSGVVQIAGWILALVFPALFLFFQGRTGLSVNAELFLGLLSATLTMWIFRLVPEYVAAIFMIVGSMILGIGPNNVILSGFTSNGFFMIISILGLGAVIVASGLSYRVLLVMLKYAPKNQFSYNLCLLLSGFTLSMVVPTIVGRVALVTPLLTDMTKSLGYESGGRAETRLAASTFNGATLLSPIFLTSKPPNILILGLLAVQFQDQFQIFGWFVASLAAAAVLVVGYLSLYAIFFPNKERAVVTREQLEAQLRMLGTMKIREWAAVACIIVFSAGVMTAAYHKIDPPWIGLAVMYVLLALAFLRGSEFGGDIDWPFVVFFGGIVGMVNTAKYLDLDVLMTKKLSLIGHYMSSDFTMFLFLLIGAMFLIRLVVPIGPATIILATLFIPLADASGVNPWMIGFIILLLGEMWFLPYQCHYYVQFRDLSREGMMYNERRFLAFNATLQFVKFAAVFASIPYWKYLAII